jgi:hypothetical protein
MEILRVLDTIASYLESRGGRFAVVGGLAVQGYGLARATQDLDIVVDAVARLDLIGLMESLGYETLHASEGFSNHLHSATEFGRVDFIYVDGDTAKRLFASCRLMPWTDDRTISVPSPEHLIAMKVHAIKNDASRLHKELADIQHLMKLPDVRSENVRRYFETAGLLKHYHDLERLG